MKQKIQMNPSSDRSIERCFSLNGIIWHGRDKTLIDGGIGEFYRIIETLLKH